jgi:hypothetical protein
MEEEEGENKEKYSSRLKKEENSSVDIAKRGTCECRGEWM